MSILDRISVDPAIRFGKPCVRGTRITVGDVLGYLAGGMSEDQVIGDFPQLRGAPPKVVWVRLGNCATVDIAQLLRRHRDDIQAFDQQDEATFLALG